MSVVAEIQFVHLISDRQVVQVDKYWKLPSKVSPSSGQSSRNNKNDSGAKFIVSCMETLYGVAVSQFFLMVDVTKAPAFAIVIVFNRLSSTFSELSL